MGSAAGPECRILELLCTKTYDAQVCIVEEDATSFRIDGETSRVSVFTRRME